MSIKLKPFNDTFGLPPMSHISNEMIINSMPIAEIIPGRPNFSRGLNLFNVEPDRVTYDKILNRLGYETPDPIRIAFLADNFPTDSFTNEYGETFLQKFTDVASQGLAQINQMTGSTRATEGIGKIGGFVEETGKDVGGVLGGILSGAGGMAQSTVAGIEKMLSNMQARSGGRGLIGGGLNVVNKMLAGHRVDFPQIWTNSGFTPSYSMTVRLYNPNPASAEATDRHIVGPLAVLLTLAVPRSDDGRTYSWPFFHTVVGPGLYNLDPAVITNITVVKGGDQQQISYRQTMGIVDVRIDFTSLYTSMIVEEAGSNVTNRPTLRNYLNAIKHTSARDDLDISTRNQLNLKSGQQAGVNNLQAVISGEVALAAQELTEKRLTSTVTPPTTAGSRQINASVQATLTSESPSGVLVIPAD